jgi:hypothetical protein
MLQYSHMTPILSREQHEHNMYPAAHHIPQSAISERSWAPTDSTASNLADAFGDLQIGLAATGMLGHPLEVSNYR